MRIITIGDLHGKTVWKNIRQEEWDYIVFAGDYVDADEITDKAVVENLAEIIRLKASYYEKVILLWGNHDLAYFFGGHKRHVASGFRQAMLPDLFNLYTKYRDYFQAAWQSGNYIWTHAGSTKEWYDLYIAPVKNRENENLSLLINRLFRDYYEPLFHIGVVRGGLYNTGGIFWADRRETEKDPLPGYHQVVGHSKTGNGILSKSFGNKDTSVTYVDCLNTETAFFELEIY
ncbi:MAG: metallophosphoesterase [Bacteroidales bacterium]|nr:metallophosphoesterase [Bacteroidales bacterium]